MLYKAKTLKGYRLHACDGEIGKVNEFYFDDRHWTVRHLVADTGNWLTGRQVLISPYALVDVNHNEKFITVDLTKKQIEDSPSLDTDKPVSRQFEYSYYGYYGYPGYWGGPLMWGYYPNIERDRGMWREPGLQKNMGNSHLRSTHDVSGRNVEATDGNIGHVDDFIIDESTWAIRYLVVDTKNWWSGKKVLVAPQWIEHVSWSKSKVFISLSCEAIKLSPEFVESDLLTRDYETNLHQHYGRKGYWASEGVASDSMPGLASGKRTHDHAVKHG